jgi:hypothetical protein
VESTPTSPTTNNELGVLGAQRAEAEEAARRRMALVSKHREAAIARENGTATPEVGEEAGLRLSALALAQQAPADGIVSAEDVAKRALVYLAFIKGETNG